MRESMGCYNTEYYYLPFPAMRLKTNIILEKPKNYKLKKEEL
jgi:hypothetical protein